MSSEPSQQVAAKIARDIAKEYANHTDEKLDIYFQGTTESINKLSATMAELALSVQNGNHQLARYEERQIANQERMERIERTVRDLGVHQREHERTSQRRIVQLQEAWDGKIANMEKDVDRNSQLRKAVLWLIGILLAALVTTGVAVFNPANRPDIQ